MALKEHGVEKFGRSDGSGHRPCPSVERHDRGQAGTRTRRADQHQHRLLRHKLDRADAAALKAFNAEIMLRLQEEGIACVSDTTVHGEYCLRAAINNHRTRAEDLDVLVRETVRLGLSIAGRASLMTAGRVPGAALDVGEWLIALGLEQYEAAFRENAIDGAVLPTLTADDLREMGVAASAIAAGL